MPARAGIAQGGLALFMFAALSELLSPIPGVVEHGLFVGLARAAIIAGAEGVEVLGDPN